MDRPGPGSGGPRTARAASETGGDGGAWLDGDAAEAIACDAAMAPIVTGDVNIDALEDLVRLCVELDGSAATATARPAMPAADTTAAWAALEQAVIGKAVDLLSGPGRAGQSSCAAASSASGSAGRACRWTSGTPRPIPAGIRNAVMLRDRHCQWAGGCNQPAGGVRGAPHQAQGQRRQDVGQGLRAAVQRSTTRW